MRADGRSKYRLARAVGDGSACLAGKIVYLRPERAGAWAAGTPSLHPVRHAGQTPIPRSTARGEPKVHNFISDGTRCRAAPKGIHLSPTPRGRLLPIRWGPGLRHSRLAVCLLAEDGLAEAVALAGEDDDVGVVNQAVNEGGGQAVVAEDGVPLGELQV